MVLVKSCFFALLKLAWMIIGAAQYDTCSGDLTWLGDGYCNPSTNTPECEYDGGDCCSCSCLDGPIYTCDSNGYDCKDAACIDPNLQTKYPYCDGNLLLWNDGECDAENNIEIYMWVRRGRLLPLHVRVKRAMPLLQLRLCRS